MKVGLFLNQPVYFSPNIGYSVNYWNLIDFFLCFGEVVESLYIWVPTIMDQEGFIPLHLPENVIIKRYPYWPNKPLWRIKAFASWMIGFLGSAFSDEVDCCDVLGGVGLSSSIIPLILCYYLRRKPIFFLIRGDRFKTVRFSKERRLKKRATLFRIKLYEVAMLEMAKKRDVWIFTQGDDLKEKYAKLADRRRSLSLNAVIDEKIVLDEKKWTVPEVINILYVGRLSKEKGLEVLLQAFRAIVRKTQGSTVSNVKLHIVGSGRIENTLKSCADKIGIGPFVRFHGFVPFDRLLPLYDRSQIFVLPSFTEGLPRVLFEAMARGLAIVATRVGGISWMIKDGENGLLVDPGDVNKLEKALRTLLEDEDLRYRLIQKGLLTAREGTFQKKRLLLKKILEKGLGKLSDSMPHPEGQTDDQ